MIKKIVNKRESNIELLRIISMIMIILSHYTCHNGVDSFSLNIGFNRLLLEITTLGNIGVIIFVLITGYFGIESKKVFRFKKLYLLLTQILSYSLIILILFLIFNGDFVSTKMIIKSIFPISFEIYGFLSVYIILYIFTPFINKFLYTLNRSEHLILILISLFIFSILGTINTCTYYANDLVQFILYYVIGAYLKLYKNNIFSNKKNNLIIFFGTLLIMITSVIVLDSIGLKFDIFGKTSTYLFRRPKITSIILSVSIFNIFVRFDKINSNFVNNIASTVLGIYLIHDNPLIRNILWTDILKVQNYVSSKYLFLHMILSVILVFIFCSLIEFIRKKTLEKIFIKIYDKICNKENIFNKVLKLYKNSTF